MKGWTNVFRRLVVRQSAPQPTDTFVPREWADHFASLGPDARRAAASAICARVTETAALDEPVVAPAIRAIATGAGPPDGLVAIRSLLDRCEQTYEAVLNRDEAKLSHSDEQVRAAFLRARAATTLLNALEGDLPNMAYEAWIVLDDLGELRRLAGVTTAE